jgi:uncharacterized protein YjeT (DUF2065 family)
MVWEIFLTAVALVLVLEGIMPFAAPTMWRRMMVSIATQSDRAIRIVGFISLIAGALLMYLVHSGIL